ncbi:3-hydroxyacyl-CoA dehydrogenase [Chromatocurvus halotolerans]|uniref:3-hydroxyacyl-CoA dehydrogenase n=1 Tax=Chromatocurvus halotolerans TaxID=1132028 RepID=A0A4R2L046_9GAMM|nr:3-hydroxyacyl-CoA dehydrogenase [Chromatocurvus halotolerans]TCO77109.1 3-hydroxyacyl-CoA dehydrogenase [Chromatocurvus halotolerans]
MNTTTAASAARSTATDGGQGSDAPVAIIGAGSIGSGFALQYALSGLSVRLYDEFPDAFAAALEQIRRNLGSLRDAGLVTATDTQVLGNIRAAENLEDAVDGVQWVQECAPENLELKRELFARLDRCAPVDAILASSSSAMPASRFASALPGSARCLVAHPGNPPYLLRVIELVPAEFTDPDLVLRAEAFSRRAGLHPVRVQREVEGFVFNRLQGAMLREAYCLVRDGVASVEDIDTLVRLGLGLRWSVVGPFETVDLNTRGGIAAHAEKLGPAYARMGAERGQDDPWTPDLVASVEAQRRALLPLDQWQQRVAWRDRALMQRLALASPSDGTASD